MTESAQTDYNKLSTRQCFALMVQSDDYWDIKSQVEHRRWSSILERVGGIDNASKVFCDEYIESGGEESFFLWAIFEIAELKLRRLERKSSPFKRQA